MSNLTMSKEMGTGIDVMLQVGSGRQFEADETVGIGTVPIFSAHGRLHRSSTFTNADWH
jgi:hypothetical protein